MNNPFESINNRLSNLEALALEMLQYMRNPASSQRETDGETPLTVQQTADFLSISQQTVYQNIAKIPHRKRHGRLYFFKSELAAYLNQTT
ncbi:helix-turn-helix domain-containing protein [Spirosoma jeollabukense]